MRILKWDGAVASVAIAAGFLVRTEQPSRAIALVIGAWMFVWLRPRAMALAAATAGLMGGASLIALLRSDYASLAYVEIRGVPHELDIRTATVGLASALLIAVCGARGRWARTSFLTAGVIGWLLIAASPGRGQFASQAGYALAGAGGCGALLLHTARRQATRALSLRRAPASPAAEGSTPASAVRPMYGSLRTWVALAGIVLFVEGLPWGWWVDPNGWTYELELLALPYVLGGCLVVLWVVELPERPGRAVTESPVAARASTLHRLLDIPIQVGARRRQRRALRWAIAGSVIAAVAIPPNSEILFWPGWPLALLIDHGYPYPALWWWREPVPLVAAFAGVLLVIATSIWAALSRRRPPIVAILAALLLTSIAGAHVVAAFAAALNPGRTFCVGVLVASAAALAALAIERAHRPEAALLAILSGAELSHLFFNIV